MSLTFSYEEAFNQGVEVAAQTLEGDIAGVPAQPGSITQMAKDLLLGAAKRIREKKK